MMKLMRQLVFSSSVLILGCATHTSLPAGRFNIVTSIGNQDNVFETIKKFGVRNSLSILHGGFNKQGRYINQLMLKRGDCVLLTVDNFRNKDVVQLIFFNCDGNNLKKTKHMLFSLLKNRFGDKIVINASSVKGPE